VAKVVPHQGVAKSMVQTLGQAKAIADQVAARGVAHGIAARAIRKILEQQFFFWTRPL